MLRRHSFRVPVEHRGMKCKQEQSVKLSMKETGLMQAKHEQPEEGGKLEETRQSLICIDGYPAIPLRLIRAAAEDETGMETSNFFREEGKGGSCRFFFQVFQQSCDIVIVWRVVEVMRIMLANLAKSFTVLQRNKLQDLSLVVGAPSIANAASLHAAVQAVHRSGR